MAEKRPKYSLEELLAQLEDADPSRRRAALSALSALGGGERIFDVVRKVVGSDTDVGVRYTARCMLFRHRMAMPGPDVDPPAGLRPHQIARLLDQADAYTRIRYARRLCEAYGTGVLSILARHLRPDEDPWVLSAVIQAFRRHGCPEDIARLLPFLRHPEPRVVADSIEALADLDLPRSLPYLGTFLRSPDNRIQANAIVACHGRVPREAAEALRAMSRRPEVWMRVSALYCMDQLEGAEIHRLCDDMIREEGEPWIRKRLERILEAKASDIVLRERPAGEDEPPDTALREERARQNDASDLALERSAGDLPDAGATGKGVAIRPDRDLLVEQLRRDLKSAEPSVRSSAVLALAQNVDPGVALPELERVEAQDPSLEVRFLTRRHLARVSEDLKKSRPIDNTVILADKAAPSEIPELLERCRPENLPQLYLLLAERFGAEALPWFHGELERRGNALVLSALVHSMVPLLEAEERVPILGRLLRHPNARVVADAVEMIALEQDERGFSLLIPLLSHEDNRVRANAITALIEHDRPRAIQTLGLMVKSNRTSARASALHCLQNIEGSDALGLAVLLWQKEDDTGRLRKLARLLIERLDEAHLMTLAMDAVKRGDRKGAIAAEIFHAVCRRLNLNREAIEGRARTYSSRLLALAGSEEARPGDDAPTIVEGATAPGYVPEPKRAPPSVERRAGLPAWLLEGRRPVTLAASGLLALVLACMIRLASVPPAGPSTPEVASAPISELEAASRAARGGELRGRTVTWEGRVLRQYPEAVVCKAGSRLFIARGKAPKELDLRKGDQIRIRGRIAGTNTAGAVYLDPLEWKGPEGRGKARPPKTLRASALSAWAPKWARERRGEPSDRP